MAIIEDKYDSREDTMAHIQRVAELVRKCEDILEGRAMLHDASKLESPEKELFDEMTPLLKNSTYGSDKYKMFLEMLKPALDHHYAANSHHPEHYPLWKCSACNRVFGESAVQPADDGIRICPQCCSEGTCYEVVLDPHISVDGMSLLDLLEMLCDWKAAGERHADGSIEKSLQINKKRFAISDQLNAILRNTAIELGWMVRDGT